MGVSVRENEKGDVVKYRQKTGRHTERRQFSESRGVQQKKGPRVRKAL